MPLVPILAGMEMEGVALDTVYLQRMSQEMSQRLGQLEQQVQGAVGWQFNLNSPPQLSEALFERLKIPPPDRTSRTKTGFYSTSADVLETLSGVHPVVDLVLGHPELAKLRSTYLEALPQQGNPHTGRVHTSYNQTGSGAGGLSPPDPHPPNIPI